MVEERKPAPTHVISAAFRHQKLHRKDVGKCCYPVVAGSSSTVAAARNQLQFDSDLEIEPAS
jgi:hypothetical protein